MFNELIVGDYIRALLMFISVFVLIRILLFIFERILLFFTKKTKTDLDDLLVKKLGFPLTLLAVFFSLSLSLRVLVFEDYIEKIVFNLLYSFVIVVIAYIIYTIVNILLVGFYNGFAKKGRIKIDQTLFSLFNGILNIVLISISILYVLNIWGFEIGPLLAGLGIAGIAVALALQPLLSNLFSGAAIVLDGSIKARDVVYIGTEIKGTIDKIGLRSTRIRTFDNEYIIIPNNKIADSSIQNIGLPEPKSRVVIPFSVAYGSNIEKVKKVVLKEIKKIENLSKEDEPMVRFLEMADSSLDFKAYFYVESYTQRFGAIDEANTRIYNALNKARINIPFPQMDVHIKKE